MADLLIELLSEEIPARMQPKAAEDLRRLMTDGLVEAGLTYAHAASFATPRRLALAVEGLSDQSRAVREERKGPATSAPEAAVQGFLRATGLTLDQLERRQDKKGETFFAVIEKPGRAASEIVAEVLGRVIRDFPWPKSMRWGSGSLRWVRPLQSILCLLVREEGAEIVPFEIEGIRADNTTRGHRFHAPGEFAVTSFEDYEAKLKRAHVVLQAAERRDRIRHDAATLAFAQGLEIVEDEGLLTEVAGLVEWPVTLMGRIEEQFLGLPPEVLQTSMKEHQKFFSVRNPATGRIEGFVTVANIETADRGETILAGNAKVLRARLSDARFFWENDLRVAKSGMEEWKEGLRAVTFHNKLGSQWERIERIAALAREIAPHVGAEPDLAAQAATVAKLDLRSSMVGEFPELQGLMGRYYAEAAGLPSEVAAAADEHYSPLGPNDEVPVARVSVAVALADKIDTLTGFWAIDEKPTGSKDPFALRRAALGVIRLISERDARLPLQQVLEEGNLQAIVTATNSAADKLRRRKENPGIIKLDDVLGFGGYGFDVKDPKRQRVQDANDFLSRVLDGGADGITHFEGVMLENLRQENEARVADLLSFLHDRLKVHLRDQGIRHDVIDACLAMPGNDDLVLLVRRAEALAAFLKTEDGENLLQGFKRAANLLGQAEAKDGVEYSFGADPKWSEYDEERALFAALDAAEARIRPAMEQEDFGEAMSALAALRGPIDAFFTVAQINTDNQVIRRNRLNLLSRIRRLCLEVADLTKVEG
ncbi:glycine--tRNA ligase subunit beta [Rubellimicrobium rubrum]|uniref:Glycine--tRNA ligase beta subunit n=1 Tax=Rubellimicrobium rubrum TaxID=2585369 RepID=A0A5C4MY51_9RHOB|nr:glycine--tRNA ligase subunit beta [Rubellimicrobium rubrum]TNC50065.1 glycine--tRNA ligase subunit beta [Rubellimicrobium rubrum]